MDRVVVDKIIIVSGAAIITKPERGGGKRAVAPYDVLFDDGAARFRIDGRFEVVAHRIAPHDNATGVSCKNGFVATVREQVAFSGSQATDHQARGGTETIENIPVLTQVFGAGDTGSKGIALDGGIARTR